MTAHLLLVLPVALPLAVAVITLLMRRAPAAQKWVNLAGMSGLLLTAVLLMQRVSAEGIQATGWGGWPMPFGITFVGDHLSAIMVLISAIMAVAVAIYSMADMDEQRIKYGFYPFMNLLVAGVCGAFLTGDVFNLYVWFEVLLIASFCLMSLGNLREQLTANIKYVAINIVSSLFFLAGVGLLYGVTGSLNMAEIASVLAETDRPGLLTTISMLFMVAFGIKAAIFPLYYWLPAAYHTPPPSVMALFAGLLTKVGVYALIRFFTLIFTQDVGYTHTLLLWIAGFTMVSGVLGAAVQKDFRRILSFHIISQIGYMIMGLALFTPLALIGAIYYVVHNILAKSNLFLISGVANQLKGSFRLKKLSGLYAGYAGLSILFIISAFALAGFPPLSGFWGKLMLAIAALEAQEYIIVAVALAVGMMTMYSMTKIWMKGFMPGQAQEPAANGAGAAAGSEEAGNGAATAVATQPLTKTQQVQLYTPIILIAGLIVGISIFIGPVYTLGEAAATELLDTSFYIDAVLD